MKEQRRINEFGRTLTETLSMLAIVGILSVIGLWMYNAAMDRNKANTLIHEGQKRATIVAGQIGFNNQTPSLADFEAYNHTSGGTFGKNVITEKLVEQFGLQVYDVEKNVCQNILNTIGPATSLRRLAYMTKPQSSISDCEAIGNYLMIYNTDLGITDKTEPQKECYSDSDCNTECATCQISSGEIKGICIGECDSACKEGDTCGENECVVCDEKTKTCQNKCEEVEYLESNGNQYINTAVNTTDKIGVDTKFKWDTFNTTNSRFCGAIKQDGSTYLRHHPSDSVGTTFRYFVSNAGDNITSVATTDIHTLKYNSITKKYTYDNNTTNATTTTFDAELDFWLFGRNSNSSSLKNYASIKMYYFKLYDNGTLVRDFIPVHTQFDTNGKHNCMFDKVSKKLFCNAGSGDFIAGPQKI